jgi:hypothetical protein
MVVLRIISSIQTVKMLTSYLGTYHKQALSTYTANYTNPPHQQAFASHVGPHPKYPASTNPITMN